MTPTTSTYWFILGREPLLSLAELSAALSLPVIPSSESIFKAPCTQAPEELINRLGGTIKIAKELYSSIAEDELYKIIIDELLTIPGKIHFGISLYSNNLASGEDEQKKIKRWAESVKNSLKGQGRSVRYVANREPRLSSVTVVKNGLTKKGREFIIQTEKNNLFSIAVTQAVQPFEEWGKRDFGRPGRDDKSGMLPPKLALMMINVSGIQKPEQTLLDPFCGSGTILTEALLLGYQTIIGTDISSKAIEDTQKNIDWAKHTLNIANVSSSSPTIFQHDITTLSQKISDSSIDTIVTEPYLGKPLHGRETKQQLEEQATELKKLYLAAFQEFHKLLKPHGRVVIVIPCFKFKKEWIRITCIEEIKKSGFKIVPLLSGLDSVLYARPNQYVGREIWRFEKN
jgi:tRNA G10  N-methylase Trm11